MQKHVSTPFAVFDSSKRKKENDNSREGWEDGTPPPHTQFVCARRIDFLFVETLGGIAPPTKAASASASSFVVHHAADLHAPWRSVAGDAENINKQARKTRTNWLKSPERANWVNDVKNKQSPSAQWGAPTNQAPPWRPPASFFLQ